MSEPRVLVVGTGAIGEPVAGLLARHARELGFGEVTFHRRTPRPEERPRIERLLASGARMAADPGTARAFAEMGVPPALTLEEALERADVVVDCTPAGNLHREQLYARWADGRRGFVAQGSEVGFGQRYALGINDAALDPADRYVQVASCNTHAISALLQAVAFEGGADYDGLLSGDFVCVRRSADLVQEGGSIPAPRAGEHDRPGWGTHHAQDTAELFHTLGVRPALFSSAMLVNSQYMHSIRFSLELRRPLAEEELWRRVRRSPWLAVTRRTSTGTVFGFGRDHGPFGRILNHGVLCAPSVSLERGGRKVVGFVFTPQDGNVLLSNVAAAAWLAAPDRCRARLQPLLDRYLVREV